MGARWGISAAGIFNGEMGKITKISNITETIETDFDRKNCDIQFSRFRPNRTFLCNNCT